jgi:hypothetical protein
MVTIQERENQDKEVGRRKAHPSQKGAKDGTSSSAWFVAFTGSFFEGGGMGLGDYGVLLEIVVVAIGEVGTVVGATAFFAG